MKKRDEYEQFTNVLRSVLSADPKRVREQEKKEKRKPKKTSASGRVSRDKD